MTDVQKIAISWDKITTDSKVLAAAMKDRFDMANVTGIIAMARGGLAVAQLVAYYLDIRRVETISVVGYENMTKIGQELRGNPSVDLGDGAGWIVVDDLVDTGRSYRFVKQVLPKAAYVALYAKPEGKADADLTIQDFAQDVWIDFPWEVPSLA